MKILADVIIWFANIPNDKPKLVKLIKEISPKSFLIVMLVARALSSKAWPYIPDAELIQFLNKKYAKYNLELEKV